MICDGSVLQISLLIQTESMLARVASSIPIIKYKHSIWYCLVCPYSTNKLPKPSRFSQQLGLQKQFEKVQTHAAQSQKDSLSGYNFALGGAICILGSILAVSLIKQEVRDKIRMRLALMRISISPAHDKFGMYLGALAKVGEFQQQFYQNRMYEDRQILSTISKCAQLDLPADNNQQLKMYFELMDKCLCHNLENQRNSKQKYRSYQKYLEKLSTPATRVIYKQQTHMRKIISKLVKQADIQTLYLICYLKSLNVVTLSLADKEMCRSRLSEFKQEINSFDQNITALEQKNQRLLLDPYKFEVGIKRKWIRFIETVI